MKYHSLFFSLCVFALLFSPLYSTDGSEFNDNSINTSPMPLLTISGRCVANSEPDMGLANVQISLTGYETHQTTTDGSGFFTLDNVTSGHTYELTASLYGFIDGVFEVVLEDEDIDLGDMILLTRPPHPSNVTATISPDYTYVTISWSLNSEEYVEYRYDDGSVVGQLGYQNASENVRLGSVHLRDAAIDGLSWYLTDDLVSHSTVNLYIYGLDESGVPNADDVLYEITGVQSEDNTWNTLEIENPVEAPDGFFIGINTPDRFVSLGTDDGFGDPYTYIAGTQWATNSVSTNEWYTTGDLGFPNNLAIRAMGTDNGGIERPVQRAKNNPVARDAVPVRIDGHRMKTQSDHANSTSLAGSQERSAPRNDRTLHYAVYRVEEGDEDDPSNWEYLNEDEFPYSDTTYVDTDWPVYGIFCWAVIAYDNGIMSECGFSNYIPYTPSYYVEINVTTNSGDSPIDAFYRFENHDGDENHLYTGQVPASGTVFLPAVWYGMYDLTVRKPGFDDYEALNLIVDDPENGSEFDVELIETLLPVEYGYYEVDGGMLMIWWNPPDPYSGEEFTEGFEEGDLLEGWIATGVSTDESQTEPSYFHVTDYEGDTFSPLGSYHAGLWWSEEHQDEWLITPEFICDSDTYINWKCVAYEGSTHNDHYYLKVSTNGGSSWDTLWDASELSGGWNYYDYAYDVSLGEYNEQNIKVAWHCVDGDSNDGLWYSFFVDNITVSNGRNIIHFDAKDLAQETRSGKAKKAASASRDRHLLGYRLTRNNLPLEDLWEENEYIDEDGFPGCVYHVYAVYSTGESEPFIIIIPHGTNDDDAVQISTKLMGNCPNPFNPETRIDYSLSTPGMVSLDIYNTKGQLVKRLENTRRDAGKYSVIWHGDNDSGKCVASGIYFCNLKVDGKQLGMIKMALLK